jgi:hypothetical protein
MDALENYLTLKELRVDGRTYSLYQRVIRGYVEFANITDTHEITAISYSRFLNHHKQRLQGAT